MTLNFRLLAGLTSLLVNLCFVHFSASGPSGALDSNFMISFYSSRKLGKHKPHDQKLKSYIRPPYMRSAGSAIIPASTPTGIEIYATAMSQPTARPAARIFGVQRG